MFEGENRCWFHQVCERQVGRISVFSADDCEARFGLGRYEFHYVGEEDALEAIVEAAPSRHAVHIALNFSVRKAIELLPGKPHRLFYEAFDAKIPGAQVHARNVSLMQHRPLQRERLPGWQPAFVAALLFEFFAFAAFAENHGGLLRMRRPVPGTPISRLACDFATFRWPLLSSGRHLPLS